MDTTQEAVNKGATLLDKILPGWHRQVCLDRLVMGDGSLCMMGQLFGHKVEGQLAREMYPEEFEKARTSLVLRDPDGWTLSGMSPYGNGVVQKAITKLGLQDSETTRELIALKRVCNGMPTKCEWANAVAERLAKDAEEGEKVE